MNDPAGPRAHSDTTTDMAVGVNPYAGVGDVTVLRASADALVALVAELDQYVTDLDAEPATPARTSLRRGVRTARDMAMRHHGWASSHLRRHNAAAPSAVPSAAPIVRDPAQLGTSAARLLGQQRHPAVAVITDPTRSVGLSTLHLWLPPHHVGSPRVHHHTATVLVIHHGTLLVLWWGQQEQRHTLVAAAGHHIAIPPQTPYALLNPHADVTIATQVRDHAHAHLDTHPQPHLGPQIQAHLATHTTPADHHPDTGPDTDMGVS